ncbi:Cyclic di-GMP phosphodiesterase Gmr [Ferriphaselus amnicola]|uniref:Cyclic di-GMP phosphodiesterase Gmr n=1 Tax=Ferriphaselus amnicola TaxID=1188319 RepID=A0A2Z6GC08_9PROT|nr:bacteriohemerythrin [Ferriphaselus amnicola]BBE50977.1 Cyclic di-GMP phosphodiesterase Gmr [Ferriphaselus amnicola]
MQLVGQFYTQFNSNLATLNMALDAAQESVWEWNLQTGEAKFSPQYYTLLGYLPDEFPANQQEWQSHMHPDDRAVVLQQIQRDIEQQREIHVVEFRMRTKDGRYRWMQGRGKCVECGADGHPIRMLGVNLDINDHKQMELQVSYLAYHDKLTGLANRSLFLDRLSQSLSQAKRSNTQVAVLFADLDGFKLVNDKHGHEIGDEVLKIAAQRFLACLRETDTVSRFGGDEFAIFLGGLTSQRQASIVAAKIIDAFSIPMSPPGGAICEVGVSIGISMFPENGTSLDSLLMASDQAMYDSKRHGKNSYTLFSNPEGGEVKEWITFTDTHLIGISKIDEEHRGLVNILNQLSNSWRNGDSHDEIISIFNQLLAETTKHFTTEELLMRKYEYPEHEQHELEHARLLDEAVRLRNRLSDGGELLALQTIKDWLFNHIAYEDKRMAEHLKANGVH